MRVFYHIKQLGLIFLENRKTVSMLKVYYQFDNETGWLTVLN